MSDWKEDQAELSLVKEAKDSKEWLCSYRQATTGRMHVAYAIIQIKYHHRII
jgi:hypothetical protein